MVNKNRLVIGSRGSKLALWQSNHIKDLLEGCNPGLKVEIKIIKTTGDIIQDVALSKIGDKGLFTKELEVALAQGDVDLCVHSMKDVPTVLPEGLILGPMPQREAAYDALVAGSQVKSIDDLPDGARIGTGSLRRRAQLYALDRGFELVELRGNLDTRIKKVEEGLLDAVILAAAGIQRLGWQKRISAFIPLELMIPAVGQGALALEMREDDENTRELCGVLAHSDTELCVSAERQLMKVLEGGCQVPIGAYASVDDDTFSICAMVSSVDGSTIIRVHTQGALCDSASLTQQAINQLIDKGAEKILKAVRADAAADGSLAPLYQDEKRSVK